MLVFGSPIAHVHENRALNFVDSIEQEEIFIIPE